MKVIIAGSRSFGVYAAPNALVPVVMKAVLDSGYKVTEVVSGTARGIDRAGELWAESYAPNHPIPVRRMPANWDLHGRAAGYLRNQEMGEYADAAIVIWDGHSNGSRNMATVMKELRKPCFLVTAKGAV